LHDPKRKKGGGPKGKKLATNREGDKDTVKKRKTYLACDSVRNITSILLAANKFLYAASKEF